MSRAPPTRPDHGAPGRSPASEIVHRYPVRLWSRRCDHRVESCAPAPDRARARALVKRRSGRARNGFALQTNRFGTNAFHTIRTAVPAQSGSFAMKFGAGRAPPVSSTLARP